jgi:hypothetical protein
MKIIKIKEDITSEIANSFKNSIAIDTEATGLQITLLKGFSCRNNASIVLLSQISNKIAVYESRT